MTEQQQLAVEAAKDALALLASERMEVSRGTYFSVEYGEVDQINNDVKTTFDSIVTEDNPCQVCALGGLLLAITLKKNELSFRDLQTMQTSVKARNMLQLMSSPYQIALIEAAFELGYNDALYGRVGKVLDVSVLSEEDEQAAKDFYRKYDKSIDRFVAIMENIIANDGIFTL